MLFAVRNIMEICFRYQPNIMIRIGIALVFAQCCFGQLPGGVSLGNRRAPQIAPPRIQPQQPNTNHQQPGSNYNQPYQPNNFFNPNMLARRLNLLETEMRRMQGTMGAMGNNLRVTLSTTLTDRLGHIRQEVDSYSDNISQNKEKLNQVAQEVKYLKNSNANMQKRLNQIEAKQSEQQASIESLSTLLENTGDFTLPPDGADVSDYSDYGREFSQIPSLNRTQITKLYSVVEGLRHRLNDTDKLINNHDQHLLQLGFEFKNIRQASDFLQGENLKTSQNLNNLNNAMSQMQVQVDSISEDIPIPPSSTQDQSAIDVITSSLNGLRNDVIGVQREQRVQKSSIRNLTLSLDLATSFGALSAKPNTPTSDYYGNDGGTSNDNMVFDLARTVSDLEERFKNVNENGQVELEELAMRMTHLDNTVGDQGQQTSSLLTRVNNLQQTSQKLQENLLKINTTVQQHDGVINEVVPPEDYPSLGFVPYPLDSRDQFPANLTNQVWEPPNFDIDARFKVLEDSTKETIGIQNNRLQAVSDKISLLESQLQPKLYRSLTRDLNNVPHDANSAIEDVINAMNTSIVVQNAMLNQGIREIGNYNQRLRRNEARDSSRDRELTELRELLENTTVTLSEMSMHVAEHQLTIPSIFESLKTGDDILLDLNEQIYQQQLNLDAMNLTVQGLGSDTVPNQLLNDDSYVTHADFSALAEALAGVAMRIDTTTKNLDDFKNKSNYVSTTNTNTNQDDNNQVLQTLTTQIELINRKCSLSQFAIQDLSLKSDNLTQEINLIQATIAALPINATGVFQLINKIKSNNEISNLLDTSMGKLVTNANNHKKWIISLRKRIRNLEGLKLKTCAHMSDVSSLNTTLSDKLVTLNNVVESISPLCEDKKQTLNELNENLNGDFLLEDEPSDSQNENNVSKIAKMLHELRSIPLSVRLLETQVHTLQEAMQTLPKLNTRVETLNSMRNLVFKNAQDVSSFHESVAALERSIHDVSVILDSVQFSHNRLDSYHHDLRSQLNDTKKELDGSNDQIVGLVSNVGLINRHLSGNLTEVKDSLKKLTTNLQEKSQQLETVSQKLDDVDNYAKHNSAQGVLRVNEVDSQLTLTNRRVKEVKARLQQHDNSIDLLTRSGNEDRNTQRNAVSEVNSKLLQLTARANGLVQKVNDMKLKTTQNEDMLANLNNQQLTTSDELSGLTRSNTDILGDLRGMNSEINSLQSDVNLQNTKMNNFEDELTEVTNSVTSQASNIMSVRQSFLTANDEINNLQQAVQRHDLFVRRADQTIEKQKFDISFILEHSSNHTVAIERIKQLVDVDFADSLTNNTQEMLNEIRLIDQDLRNVKDEMVFVKRQSSVRDNTATQLELQISEVSSSLLEQGNKVRANKESINLVKGDLNRQKNKVRELEHISTEQRTFNEDLQQVVLSNRNDLVSLNNLQSTLEQTRTSFVKVVSRQENQTRAIKLVQDQQANEILRIRTSISEHDRTLNNMQQDRFSLEGDIDQIYQSSRNLENLLRTTVTQLNDLRKEFDDSAGSRLIESDIEKKTTKLQEMVRNSIQTMNSNENKISQIQGTIERMSLSIYEVTNNLHTREQVDRSRIAESRDLRNKIDRTSLIIRNLQRDLRNNNDRLRSLIHHQSTNINVPTPTKPTTTTSLDSTNDLEASGWINTGENSEKQVQPTENQPSIDSKQFYENLNALSNEIFKLNEAIDRLERRSDDQSLLQNITSSQVSEAITFSSQNLQRSEEINTALLSLITALELDVIKLSNQVSKPSDYDNIIASLSRNVEESKTNAQNALKLAERCNGDVSSFRNEMIKQVERLDVRSLGYQQNLEERLSESFLNLNNTLNKIILNNNGSDKGQFDKLRSQIITLLNNRNQKYLQNIETINSTLDMVLNSLEENLNPTTNKDAQSLIQNYIRANFSELRQQINDVVSQFDILFELINNLEETTYQLQDKVNDNGHVSDLDSQMTHLSTILNDILHRIETLDHSSKTLHHRNSKQITANTDISLTNQNSIERILMMLDGNAISLAEQGANIDIINTTLNNLDITKTEHVPKQKDERPHRTLANQIASILNSVTYELNQVNQSSHIIINKSIGSFFKDMTSYSFYPEVVDETDSNDIFYGREEEINGFKEDEDQMQDGDNLIKDTNENLIHIVSVLLNVFDQITNVLNANIDQTNTNNDHNKNLDINSNLNEENIDSTLNDVVLGLAARIQYLEEEPSLPPELFYELLTNMTTLSDKIRVMSSDELALFGRNENITAQLRKDFNAFKNQIKDIKTPDPKNTVAKLTQDFRTLNETVSALSESQDFQDLSISNMLHTQNSNGQRVTQCKQTLQNLTREVKQIEASVNKQMQDKSDQLDRRLNEMMTQLSFDQQNIMSDLFGVMDDITTVNLTIQSLANYIGTIQADFQVQLSGVDINEVLRRTLDQHEEQLNQFNEKQMEQETVLTDFENTNLQLTNDLLSAKNDIANMNKTTHRLHSSSKARLMKVVESANSAHFRIEQSLDQHDRQIATLREITNAIGQRVASEIGELALQMGDVNATLQSNKLDLTQLQSDTNALETLSQKTNAVLMRHSVEQKGFTRSIQATENLLRTMMETVSLHSSQITILTGEVMSAPDKYKHTISFLTEIVSNHSIDLMHLYNQMSSLSNRVRNPTSVRVIVPPSGPIRIPVQTTTTTSTTTTTDSSLGKPPSPSGLTVIASTHNELTLTWILVSGVREYRLVIQNINGSPQITKEIVVPHSPVTIHGLAPDTRYLLTLFSAVGQQLSQPHSVIASTSSLPTTTTTTTTTQQTTTTSTFDPNEIIPDLVLTDNNLNRDSSKVFSCDFDNGLCGFVDGSSDDFDWIRRNGSTPSADTGPSRDHTQGSDHGYYMFIESSRPRRVGDIAQLITPNFQTPSICVDFYYHMFGVGTGGLNVLVGSSDGATSKKIWGETGNLGNQWKHAEISVVSSEEFNIIFEAVRGADYHGDTAIDDIIVKRGACPQPLISCGFETPGLCGFVQETDDDFDWTLQKGATSSADTGPVADHTLANADGYYVFIEASNPRKLDDKTRLASSTLSTTTGQCLQFYYHMHGADTGSLNVYLRQVSTPNDLGVAIWNKEGPQGNDWILGRVSVVSVDSFQIVFEAIRGGDYHGDIALDDITITEGLCENPVCPVGVRFLEQCYKVEKDGKTYQDARAHCQSNGGLLAAIKTQEQQDFIVNLLSNEGNRWTLFWIGLDDLTTEGQFRFSDGTSLDLGAFGAWTDNEPNDALGDEDCVNMEYSSKNRRWNDVPCDRELWFICQYDVTV